MTMFISDGDISIDCNAVQNCHAPQATPNRAAIQLCRRAETMHSHTIVCVCVIFLADNRSAVRHEKVNTFCNILVYTSKWNQTELKCFLNWVLFKNDLRANDEAFSLKTQINITGATERRFDTILNRVKWIKVVISNIKRDLISHALKTALVNHPTEEVSTWSYEANGTCIQKTPNNNNK